MPSPTCGTRGSAMPMKPPTTQDSCSNVSVRAKAEVRCRSGTSRCTVESSASNYLALERLELDDAGNIRVIWQPLHDGASLGHYARNIDGQNRAVGQAQMVATGEE